MDEIKTVILYVAVMAAVGAQRFFRCGMEFGPAWRKVEVDEATAQRLREEQMLRVVDMRPADYVEPGNDGSVGALTIGQLAQQLAPDRAGDGATGGDEAGTEGAGTGDENAPGKPTPSATASAKADAKPAAKPGK